MSLALLMRPTLPLLNNYAYGSFTAAGPVTALGSALKAWLTADDHGTARMTDDGSGLISSWTSADGSALTVTAATTARPTWSASAISRPSGGSVSGLAFDGTANCMVSTTLTNIPTGSTAGEVWISGTQELTSAIATSRNIIAYGAFVSSQGRILIRSTNSTALIVQDQTVNLIDTRFDFFGPFIIGGMWAGTLQSGRKNGLPTNPETATISTLNTGTVRLRLGANDNTSAAGFHQGVIRHVLITTTLTALQRLRLEAWLAWDMGWQRYRLPSTHPFRDRRP